MNHQKLLQDITTGTHKKGLFVVYAACISRPRGPCLRSCERVVTRQQDPFPWEVGLVLLGRKQLLMVIPRSTLVQVLTGRASTSGSPLPHAQGTRYRGGSTLKYLLVLPSLMQIVRVAASDPIASGRDVWARRGSPLHRNTRIVPRLKQE